MVTEKKKLGDMFSAYANEYMMILVGEIEYNKKVAFMSVFIIYCFIINYHKFSSLRQQTFIISQFL